MHTGRFVVFEGSVGAQTSFLGHRTVRVTAAVAAVRSKGSNHRQLHQSKNGADKVGKPDGRAVDAVVAVQGPQKGVDEVHSDHGCMQRGGVLAGENFEHGGQRSSVVQHGKQCAHPANGKQRVLVFVTVFLVNLGAHKAQHRPEDEAKHDSSLHQHSFMIVFLAVDARKNAYSRQTIVQGKQQSDDIGDEHENVWKNHTVGGVSQTIAKCCKEKRINFKLFRMYLLAWCHYLLPMEADLVRPTTFSTPQIEPRAEGPQTW